MTTWSDFAAAAPALAASIRAALHKYGAGLGYLATIRADGGPRLHPVSPAIVGGRLYCCLLDSPKRHDLDRDGRYALHAFPADDSDDEAGVSGRAVHVIDPGRVRRVGGAMHADPMIDWALYELTIDSAFLVRRSIGSRAPGAAGLAYQKWHAPTSSSRARDSEPASQADRARPESGRLESGRLESGRLEPGQSASGQSASDQMESGQSAAGHSQLRGVQRLGQRPDVIVRAATAPLTA